jgi:peroxiredoxin
MARVVLDFPVDLAFFGLEVNPQGHPETEGRLFRSLIRSPGESMALSVGDKAPEFTLKSKQKDGLVDVKLSDQLGSKNTVVLFFPLAFTGVCTQEMCDVTSGISAYENLNAKVIGISVDSPFAQEAWAAKEKISITLASDLNKETARAYGVLLDDLAGIGSAAARAAFVIDKEGVIRYAEQTPSPKELPNFEAVKAALASLN